MKKILFLCTGNTCRSPMAEAILKAKAKQSHVKLKISSAGISAGIGNPIAGNAKNALILLNIPCPPHKARQVTANMLSSFDIILTMTKEHKRLLGENPHIFTLAEFTNTSDIDDPFGMDLETYLSTARKLVTACDRIIEILK